MKKSNLTKILVAILAFSLLLGTIVGITTAADEGDVYLENADVERNVQYESQTYLLYRVAKSAIKAEDEAALCMQIASADGTVIGKVTPKLDGNYYVFTTQGVPAKELNTKEVVTVMSGDKAISPAITWSVEDYIYSRLYADGFADKTEDNGKDFVRRNLYYNLLKTGYNAQMVLAPNAEDKIGDSAFVFASDALATYGKFDEPTNITLRYDDSKTPAGDTFLGWEYSVYDSFGELVKTGYAADKSVLSADGYVKAKPVYASEFYTHSYIDFNGVDKLPAGLLTTLTTGATVSFENNNLTMTQPYNVGNSYVYVATNTKTEGANAVVFECDFSWNVTQGTEAGYFTIYTGSSGGDKVYWSHWSISGSNIRFNKEYVKTNGNQVAHDVALTTPIKCDGTVQKLRIVFREAEWGEDYLEFYVDGQLFYTTNRFYAETFNNTQTPAKVSQVGCVCVNFAKAAAGVMTLDNAAMTQCELPKFEQIGADDTIVDFDASNKDVDRYTKVTENKYYSDVIDPKTGNGYILLTKKEGGGLTIDVPVTYVEEGADLAVLSFDYYLEDSVTRIDNQIYASHKHASGYGNSTTPILVQLNTGSLDNQKGKWMHVELTYKVLETDGNGSVTKVLTSVTVTNGLAATIYKDSATGVYKNSSTQFKLFNSEKTMEVPTADELTGIRISLNDSARGDVRFDNLSFKRIKQVSE